MRRIKILIAVALGFASMAMADNTLPYNCDFEEEEQAKAWTTIDIAGDASGNKDTGMHTNGWYRHAAVPTGKIMRLMYNSTAQENDWLVSPAIKIESAGKYRVEFMASMSGGAINVAVGTEPTVEGMATIIAKGLTNSEYSLSTTKESCYMKAEFEVDAPGVYYIGFQANGKKSAFGREYRLDNVSVKDANEGIVTPPSIPLAATDITITPAAENLLKATVSWKNPSLNTEGNELDKITKIEIFRGATASAPTITVTDADQMRPGFEGKVVDESVPSGGYYDYKVVVYHNESAGAESKATSPWIGPGLSLPYDADFSNKNDVANWRVYNVNGDSKTYKDDEFGDETIETTWSITNGRFYYNSNSTTADDWLVSPYLQFEAGDYEIHLIHYLDVNAPSMVGYSLAISNDNDYRNMSEIGHASVTSHSFLYKEEQVVNFSIAENQRACIGIHANEPGMVYIADMIVQKVSTPSTRSLCGIMVWNDQWLDEQNDVDCGIYTMSIAAPADTKLVKKDKEMLYARAAELVGDEYFVISSNVYSPVSSSTLVKYNARNWQKISSRNIDEANVASDLAWDSQSGAMYGYFYNDEQGDYTDFCQMNTVTGETWYINYSDRGIYALAATGKGALYALSSTGRLYLVDAYNGNMELVGNTGIYPDQVNSMTYDAQKKRLYLAAQIEDRQQPGWAQGALYEIDPATAVPTLLYIQPDNAGYAGIFMTDVVRDDIKSIDTDSSASAKGMTYNLAGQRVGNDAKGLLIRDGRKFIVR